MENEGIYFTLLANTPLGICFLFIWFGGFGNCHRHVIVDIFVRRGF